MAYLLTENDMNRLKSLGFKMDGVMVGEEATPSEVEALNMQKVDAGAIDTMQASTGAENIGNKITSDAGAPFISPEAAKYGADKALGKDPLAASDAQSAPDTSFARSPTAASGVGGLLPMSMMQPQSQQFSTDPFEGLSRNQKMMLAFSAIQDAGLALQGKQGGAFEKTLGRFNETRDIERKRQAAAAQQELMAKVMGGQGMGAGGDINSQIQALTQAAMMGLIDPAAASLAVTQLRENQSQSKAVESVVGGGAGALDDLQRLTQAIEDGEMVTGFTGWLFRKIPWSEAAGAATIADTLRSGMALGALKELKAGGATLGSVSERELDLLESAIARINLDQPREKVLEQMAEIEKHYKDAIRKSYDKSSDVEKANFDRYFGGQTPAWVLSKETPKPTTPIKTAPTGSDEELFQEFGIK